MEPKTKCILFLVLVVVITSSILLGKSFETVDPTNYGLKCNTLSKQCDMQQTYEGGRYFVGVANYFIEFPRHLKTMEYSDSSNSYGKPLVCRTKDYFTFTMEISFQYELIRESIGALYKKNSINYEQTLNRQAKDIIMQTAAEYKVAEYWSNRLGIAKQIQQNLDKEFLTNYVNCRSVQILYIGLPASYEKKIVETQVEKQLQKQKELERQSLLIRKSVDVLRSQNDASIKEILSQANATAYITEQTAEAAGIQTQITSEVTVNTAIKNDLTLTGKDLQKYIYYNAIMNQPNSKLLFGADSTIL